MTQITQDVTPDAPLVQMRSSSVRPSRRRPLAPVWTCVYLFLFGIGAAFILIRYWPESNRDWAIIAAALLASAIPWSQRLFLKALSITQRIALRPLAAGTIVGGISICIAVAFSRIVMPIPEAHDEHSYMLAADTFSRGRLANPAHPMWRHLETMHVIHNPTYASKYPPAQGLALGMGKVVFGVPLAGVWIIGGLGCAAVLWALRGYVPPRWALLGALLVAISPILLDWNVCYWGGGIALLGGALMLGAVPRIAGGRWRGGAIALGAGAGLLAMSRPYEAVILAGLAGIGLLGASLLTGRVPWLRVAAMSLVSALPAVIFLLVYHKAVTGSAWTMPYQVHDDAYNRTPHFVFQGLRPERAIAHRDMAEFHNGWEVEHWTRQQSMGGWLADMRQKCVDFLEAGAQPVWLALALVALPLAMAARHLRRGWLMFALAGVGVFALAQFVVTWGLSSHYAAPIAVLWIAVLAACLKALASFRVARWRIGRVALGALLVLAVVTTARAVPDLKREKSGGWKRNREAIAHKLEAAGGKHLVLVRYPGGHNYHMQWVYNSADIDGSAVVWARQMGGEADQKLLEYFKDRRVWVVEVTEQEGVLTPLPR